MTEDDITAYLQLGIIQKDFLQGDLEEAELYYKLGLDCIMGLKQGED